MLGLHLRTIFSFRSYLWLRLTTRTQRIGFAIYLFLLSWLVFYTFASGQIARRLPVFLHHFPQVTFEKGVLTAPQNPVYAYLPESDFNIAFDGARTTPPTSEELLEHNTLALVAQNTVYMPGSGNVQTYPVPTQFSATTTQDFLTQHQPLLESSLKATVLLLSLLVIPFIFLFDFCMAAAVGFFFNLLAPRPVTTGSVWCWAFFLQGPLAVLWYVHLWHPIPLFTLAQLILCIIYIQQIFNLACEEK